MSKSKKFENTKSGFQAISLRKKLIDAVDEWRRKSEIPNITYPQAIEALCNRSLKADGISVQQD